jgi:serine phosphatase RsbU (regulator of sigma subunit)
MNQADHDREARQLANRAVLLEHDRSTRDERLVQQIHLNGLPKRIPAIGPYYFMLTGSDGWFDVVALDETRLAFWIAQPGGLGSLTGKILGLAIRQSVTETLLKQRAHSINPSQLLEAVNAQLVSFDTNPVPMVGLGVGVLDTTSGEICFARGGIPTAMIRSGATGAARPWSDPGVFLGGFDAVFSQQQLTLNPGDTLELSTGPAGTPGNTQLVLTRRGDR